VPHEYLSDDQVGRYGRFVADPTHEELERFFFLDEESLAEAGTRRGPHNRLGWSVQWGTVRMLGTFLTDSGPVQVPEVVIRYVAEQLGIADWTAVKQYGDRPATPYDHATQIRKLLGYREFAGAEAEVTAFIASRVAKTRDSKRELFDRAVLWLIENRVLLPGISTLSRLVAEVRRVELAAISNTLVDAAPPHMHRELVAMGFPRNRGDFLKAVSCNFRVLPLTRTPVFPRFFSRVFLSPEGSGSSGRGGSSRHWAGTPEGPWSPQPASTPCCYRPIYGRCSRTRLSEFRGE
jgi:hypothetical protein